MAQRLKMRVKWGWLKGLCDQTCWERIAAAWQPHWQWQGISFSKRKKKGF